MSLCSIPFAFTENLFYPSYWEPTFLFGLADKIGFGIEDVLFVIGLAAFTSTAYAFFFRKTYQLVGTNELKAVIQRCLSVLGVTFLLVILLTILNVPMIYGSVGIMIGMSVFICFRRTDLLLPSFLGGFISLGIYTFLCLVLLTLIPDIFNMVWHTEKFLNVFVLGIPLEEYLYGFAAGITATAFYPYVFSQRFSGTNKE